MKTRSSLLTLGRLGFALALAVPLLHAEDAAGVAKPAVKLRKDAMRAAITKIEATSISVGSKTFKLDDKVVVKVNNETKAVADLKVGDVIKVKYVEEADGSFTARALLLDPADQKK